MIRILLNNNGSILSILSGDASLVSLNTAENAIYVDSVEAVDNSDYYDFDLHSFIPIGEAPSSNHTFDYNFKQWIDKRTLLDIKEQKWSQLKQQRNVFEFGGFLFDGNIYDSDQISQGRIMGAASAGVDQVWTLADNTTVNLSASQLQQLYAALQAHLAGVHEQGRIARQLIFDAETKEQVEAINI